MFSSNTGHLSIGMKHEAIGAINALKQPKCALELSCWILKVL